MLRGRAFAAWLAYRSNVPEPAQPRAALSEAALTSALLDLGQELPVPVLLEHVDSTNEYAAAMVGPQAARALPEWTIVHAEQQVHGRGRLDRSWESPAGASLLFSIVARPDPAIPMARQGWIPLLAGLAVNAVCRASGADTKLKWPNDVVVAEPGGQPRKLAGILVERAGECAIIGIGINVSMIADELPVPEATSLLLETGTVPDRHRLLAACVAQFRSRWDAWTAAGGDAQSAGLAAEYHSVSATIGARVRASLPGGSAIVGEACGIDIDGRLLVSTGEAGAELVRAVAAADVTHLR